MSLPWPASRCFFYRLFFFFQFFFSPSFDGFDFFPPRTRVDVTLRAVRQRSLSRSIRIQIVRHRFVGSKLDLEISNSKERRIRYRFQLHRHFSRTQHITVVVTYFTYWNVIIHILYSERRQTSKIVLCIEYKKKTVKICSVDYRRKKNKWNSIFFRFNRIKLIYYYIVISSYKAVVISLSSSSKVVQTSLLHCYSIFTFRSSSIV